ncbi:MAG TPA: extracellular solute-binding protein [Candidatus Magasanikbacteria bacterium]|nr:extracellular solute-binding protein [Candidatus Magasanikbacteria bacterium]
MNKKYLSLFLLIGAMVFGGLGCKGLSAADQAAIQPVTLNYWTVYNNTTALEKIVAKYKTLRPYVTVKIKQLRAEEFDSLFVNALADNVPPDVISIQANNMGKYVARLSPMPTKVKMATVTVSKNTLKNETTVTMDEPSLPAVSTIKKNFVSTVYDDVVFGDKAYGMPLALDTLVMYYNKDLLDKANIPEPPKTWEEFMEASLAGTKFSADGEVVQSGVAMGTAKNINNAFDILSLLMMQGGVKMASGNFVTFASGVEKGMNNSAVEALRFYTDFARPTKKVYSWSEKMENAFDAFTRGKSLFYFGYGYEAGRIKQNAPQMNLEVAVVPQLNPNSVTNVANYWIESVVKNSRKQNTAWDFVRFMTLPENIAIYVAETKQPTPLRSQIAKQQEDPFLAPFASSALTAKNWYHGRDIKATRDAFGQMITQSLVEVESDGQSVSRDRDAINYAARVVQQTM